MEPPTHQGYGPDQMFCLRWSNHQTNMLNVFNQLRYNESFVDVTLAVDGRVLKAHKMVLSACSPYFQKMFEMTPDKHPVVFIDRVHYQDMKRLLEFMYRGEVSIDQETLNRFLKVARSLRIRGLTEIEEPGGGGGSSLSPSTGPLDEIARMRLAEQMTAAAIAECRQRLAAESASAPSGATRRPAPCSPADEVPRKAVRRDSEPRPSSEHGLEPGPGPGPGPGSVPGVGPEHEPERRTPSGQQNGAQWPESEAQKRAASAGSGGGGQGGGGQGGREGDGGRGEAGTLTVMKKESDSEREPSSEQSPPLVPKHERADVFCQPDFWISEGIYVASQNAPGSAPGAPGSVSQAGCRDSGSPPPAGLDDTPLSPDDQASLLDYITHEDGSVTCKLCGEQVPSRNHWYRHKYRTHAWHTYKCDECGITYKSKRGFEAHLEAKHERRPERPAAEREPPASQHRRRDWEGVARALEDTRKKKEEELVSDIINRVKRECAMEGEDYTRRGYVKHF